MFFDFRCIGRKKILIKKLVANDISITSQTSLSTSINQLYTNLYKVNDPSDETFATQTTY